MRAVLLGAGASKAYGASPTGQRPPVARDFFQTFGAMEMAGHPWVLIEGLCGYLMERRGIEFPLDYLMSGIDIEALHTEIEEARDARMALSSNYLDFLFESRAYNELIYLFASVLNEIQNGPVSAAHLKLAAALAPHDAVVTFNWDTLMDRALAQATPWRPDWGYGVAPKRIFRGGWVDPAVAPANAASPQLIKLHGSTNWLTGHPSRDLEKNEFIHTHAIEPEAFAVFESEAGPYECFAGRYMGPHEPYSFGYYPPNLDFEGRAAPDGYKLLRARPKVPWRPEGQAGDGGLVSIPLIIPPVRHKSYDYFGSLFGDLWRSAEAALKRADQIVIIGYSFPPTDTQAIRLFQNAFSARSTMPKVVLIDPSPERAANVLGARLGVESAHLRVIAAPFDDELDLDAL